MKVRKLKNAGPKTIYVSNPKIWARALEKANAENKSLSEVIMTLLSSYIGPEAES